MKKFFTLLLLLSTISLSIEQKYSLITFIDLEPSFDRSFEIIECLEKNIENKLIEDIYVIYNCISSNQENIIFNYLKQRPVITLVNNGMGTFDDAFTLAHTLIKNQRIIIANSDIYFDNTLAILNSYQLNHVFLGITAYSDGCLLKDKEVPNAPDGILQDAWIFEKPFYIPTNNIPIGTIYSGALISYQALQAGFNLANPCQSLIATKKSKKDTSIFWKHPEQDMLHPIPFSKLIETTTDQERFDIQEITLIPKTTNNHFLPFIQAKDKKNKTLINPFLFILKKNFPNHDYIEINYSSKTASTPFKKNYLIENKENLVSSLENIAQTQQCIIFLNELTGKHDQNYTPYLHELETIQKTALPNPVIIISSAQLFYSAAANINHTFDNYPTLSALINSIKSIDPNYQIVCIDDLLICYTTTQVGISPVAHACTVSRLYDADPSLFSIMDVITAEKTIATALRVEKDAIRVLAENYNEKWSKRLSLGQHYPFWYGLILLQEHEYKKAYEFFKEAYERGLKHWRVKWYMDRAYSGAGGKL